MHDLAILRVNLLAGFTVAIGNQVVPGAAWRQKRAAGIVKLLALEPTHRLHREQVLDALWPDLDAETGARNLRVALHHARASLAEAGAEPGSVLVRDGESLLLSSTGEVLVDVDAFEAAAAYAWRTSDPEATEAAVAAYSGDLLPDDRYDEWAEHRRAGLQASYLALLSRLAHLTEQRGDIDRAIAANHRILSVDPVQEEAHAAIMRLLARSGRPAQALTQYQRLVSVLERELGAVPDPSTRALHEAIRASRVPPLDATRIQASPPARTNLPAPVDALIGREREVAEFRQLLTGARLVTLTGPGGVGKTRLALAVAQDLAPAFADGVCFVDLSPIRDTDLVASTIARALGASDDGGHHPAEVVSAVLRDKRMLLLLDNFEQVIDAAGIVSQLLAACPRLAIVATSRTRLRLRGEQEYPVMPLAVPMTLTERIRSEVASAAAGQLFVRRARESRPDFELTPANAAAVGEICRRLDGLPLALELAAARVRLLSPQTLLARLDSPLVVLTGGARDLPERQQTIQATIAWSYDLLSEAERQLFRRLAVFTGTWDVAAAEAVVNHGGDSGINVLDGLASLVDQSLVVRRDSAGAESRFGLLETIREFALECLAASDEVDAARSAHAAYFLAHAERTASILRGADDRATLANLEREYGNLRAALMWFEQTGAGEAMLRLAASLATFWSEDCHWVEGNAWLERSLALDPRPSLTRARALAGLGENAGYLGDTTRAESALREGIALARQLESADYAAYMLQSLGAQQVDRGVFDEGRILLAEARAEAQRAGDHEVEALSLAHLGAAAWGRGDMDEAVAQLQAARTLARDTGYLVAAEVAARYLGLIATQAGDHAGAAAWYREFFPDDPAETRVLVRLIPDVASLAMARGDGKRAAHLFGAAAALADTMSFAPTWPERGVHERAITEARAALGAPDFEAAFEAGRRLPLADVLTSMATVLSAASPS